MTAIFALNALAPDDKWVGLTEDLVGAGAALTMWVGLYRRGPSTRNSWFWLAGSLSCWVIGDLVWDAYTFLGLQRPDVSLADACYLAGYPWLVV